MHILSQSKLFDMNVSLNRTNPVVFNTHTKARGYLEYKRVDVNTVNISDDTVAEMLADPNVYNLVLANNNDDYYAKVIKTLFPVNARIMAGQKRFTKLDVLKAATDNLIIASPVGLPTQAVDTQQTGTITNNPLSISAQVGLVFFTVFDAVLVDLDCYVECPTPTNVYRAPRYEMTEVGLSNAVKVARIKTALASTFANSTKKKDFSVVETIERVKDDGDVEVMTTKSRFFVPQALSEMCFQVGHSYVRQIAQSLIYLAHVRDVLVACARANAFVYNIPFSKAPTPDEIARLLNNQDIMMLIEDRGFADLFVNINVNDTYNSTFENIILTAEAIVNVIRDKRQYSYKKISEVVANIAVSPLMMSGKRVGVVALRNTYDTERLVSYIETGGYSSHRELTVIPRITSVVNAARTRIAEACYNYLLSADRVVALLEEAGWVLADLENNGVVTDQYVIIENLSQYEIDCLAVVTGKQRYVWDETVDGTMITLRSFVQPIGDHELLYTLPPYNGVEACVQTGVAGLLFCQPRKAPFSSCDNELVDIANSNTFVNINGLPKTQLSQYLESIYATDARVVVSGSNYVKQGSTVSFNFPSLFGINRVIALKFADRDTNRLTEASLLDIFLKLIYDIQKPGSKPSKSAIRMHNNDIYSVVLKMVADMDITRNMFTYAIEQLGQGVLVGRQQALSPWGRTTVRVDAMKATLEQFLLNVINIDKGQDLMKAVSSREAAELLSYDFRAPSYSEKTAGL